MAQTQAMLAQASLSRVTKIDEKSGLIAGERLGAANAGSLDDDPGQLAKVLSAGLLEALRLVRLWLKAPIWVRSRVTLSLQVYSTGFTVQVLQYMVTDIYRGLLRGLQGNMHIFDFRQFYCGPHCRCVRYR